MAQRPKGCVRPGTVTDDDLLACARGEASRAVVEHVRACSACRARVSVYTALERQLLTGLFAPTCPQSLTLAEFALDLLPTEERATVADHLTRCPHCRAVVHSLRSRPGPPHPRPLSRTRKRGGRRPG
jgi:anti-sigma factor RsiW